MIGPKIDMGEDSYEYSSVFDREKITIKFRK